MTTGQGGGSMYRRSLSLSSQMRKKAVGAGFDNGGSESPHRKSLSSSRSMYVLLLSIFNILFSCSDFGGYGYG